MFTCTPYRVRSTCSLALVTNQTSWHGKTLSLMHALVCIKRDRGLTILD